jgi:hypothetical protein
MLGALCQVRVRSASGSETRVHTPPVGAWKRPGAAAVRLHESCSKKHDSARRDARAGWLMQPRPVAHCRRATPLGQLALAHRRVLLAC